MLRAHPRRQAALLGFAVAVLTPARAHAGRHFDPAHRSFATSIQLGTGNSWSLLPDRAPNTSFHFGVGPKFYNGNWSGEDPRYGFYLHPSVGVRSERSRMRRRYAEFAMEAGIGPSVRDGSNTWTPVTLGYRVAGLAGTVDRFERAPVYSTGLRHGPVLGLFAGVVTIDASHEVILRPDPMQSMRIGVSIELNPFIWWMTGIW